MFKHYFEQVENVEIWPIISLTIFFVFFIGLTIYVLRINKAHIKHMEEMPLVKDQEDFNSIMNIKHQDHGQ